MDPDRLHDLTAQDWTPAREDAVLQRLRAPVATRSSSTSYYVGAVLAAAAALILVFGLRWLGSGPDSTEQSQPVAQRLESGAAPLMFLDGTSATPHDERSEVVVAAATETETTVRLRRGGARFDVTPNADRHFRVEAGLVTVDVLGTEFDCAREGDRVRVKVLRGLVHVSWPGGSRRLSRGESGVFPPLEPKLPTAELPTPQPDAADASSSSGAAEPPAHPDVPAEVESPSVKRADAESLMRAADAARKAGKTKRAIALLGRVVAEHPRDSRAPLAAFTLGRLEQDRGHHRTAARYFAKVRSMGKTSLGEHALAREVEAWSAAGNGAKAKRRAEEYLRRFPKGPRAKQVQRLVAEPGG